MITSAEALARLSDAERAAWFQKMAKDHGEDYFAELEYKWPFWRRDNQRPPAGDWRVWMMLAGRGFGKTRTGAEWVRAMAEADGDLRIALVGATLNEARSIMVEGQSGLLAISPPCAGLSFEPSLRRLRWANGATATLYSAGEPESLRGPEHHIAWCDEIGKWDRAVESWNMLDMTLRLGNAPQIVATTTPRQMPLIRRLMAEPGVAITRGTTQDNRLHLAEGWRIAMEQLYAGTRLGRQELEGQLIEDLDGALWTRAMIDRCRVKTVPGMKRVVIGVDPPASSGGDACGIVVVGLGEDDQAYVLADCSVEGASPEGWARAVANAAHAWQADRIVAERNNGGDMVESTLRAADCFMPVKAVFASHGKVTRAEPVVALYERGRVYHVGAFPALEDELCGFVRGGYEGPGRSPDRGDACIWALTELMLGAREPVARVRWM
jgi:phage terminase large subunit-like protein